MGSHGYGPIADLVAGGVQRGAEEGAVGKRGGVSGCEAAEARRWESSRAEELRGV
jgi:hypothetical protein